MTPTEKAEAQENEDYEIIEGNPPEGEQEDEQEGPDHDEGQDERLSETLAHEEEERRAHKREERKRRKQKQQFARDKTREEMQWLIEQNRNLAARLESIENQTLTFHKGSLDQNYSAALQQVSVAEQALAKAIETGNGAQVPELLRARDRAMAQAAEINRAKQTVEAPRQQSMDSLALSRAKSWAAENNWFKPDGKDADSAVVKALDESLMAEGFNPATQDYWDELTDRASRYLPHRFADGEDVGYNDADMGKPSRQGRKSPPVGGSRDLSSGKQKFYVSPERVEAMKEAGIWDDPVRRQRMIQRYAEQDKLNRAAR